jgi:hypothetical protein
VENVVHELGPPQQATQLPLFVRIHSNE